MKQIKKFLKQTFIVGLLFSSAAFVFLRLMVYPLSIDLGEDGMIFIKTVLTGWLLVMIGKGAFEGLVFILAYLQQAIENRVQSILNKDAGYSTKNFRREPAYSDYKIKRDVLTRFEEAI